MKRSELFLRLTLWRTACACLIALATLVDVGRAASAASEDQPQDADVPARMLPLLRAVQSRELEELHQEKAARATIERAGVELGTWYRIGPLRDQPPLLNWMENSASSFAHRFEVECDSLDSGGAPLLAKVYPAPNFPSTPGAERSWKAHPEWIDGYLCDLPRGPAPSAGETQYTYRQITAKLPVTVELEFAVRSPESDRRMEAPNMESWRRQARYTCWLNGQSLLTDDGQQPCRGNAKLELQAGVNHFLAKITNNRHSYGFSFALVGLHPAPHRPGGHEQPWRPFLSYRAGDPPYYREAEDTAWCSARLSDPADNVERRSQPISETSGVPSGSVGRPATTHTPGATWWDALFASAAHFRTQAGGADQADLVIADFEGPDYGDWKVTGEAFGSGPARGTLPQQMKVSGFLGNGLVNTYLGGDRSTGTLTSSPVKIERRFVNFLIGGGGFHGTTCINLLVAGKVVRTAVGPNVVGGGSEALDWHSWNVGEFLGQQAVFQIVDRHEGGWGHINIDQITLSNHKARAGTEEQEVWPGLRQKFTDTQSRVEIELTSAESGVFWDHYLKSGDRAETEKVLADRFLERLASMVGIPSAQILETLGIARDAADYAEQVRRAYFTASRYRECLARIKSFRHVHAPLPGIEAAAIDSRGRIVTQMEAALEHYPVSEQGQRHRTRVEQLGTEIGLLLNKLVNTGEVRFADVVSADDGIEQMWVDEIRSLPPIAFLQRPAYPYDALMFTHNGASPAYLRLFDPAARSLRTLFHAPQMRAHDMTLSWDAKTIFIGGGGVVAAVGVDGTGYRVISTGQSPTELPDGRVIFFDDAPGISPCKATGVRRLLFAVNRDGSQRQVVSANLTIDTTPQIMTDGRVIFCRWDYGVNKNVFNRHGIWVQNPDGTALDLFFGNTIIDPFGFYRPRQIPGRPEVVCTFGTHHNHNAGLVGLIWQGAGREGGDGAGFQRLTHDTASVGDACPHWAYQDPYPLNEQLFLVSYGGTPDRNVALYLLDRFGNKKCLFEPADNLGAFCPQPFVPRERPPRIAERTEHPHWQAADPAKQLLSDPDWSQKAELILQDVYRGIEPEVQRGRVKHLAVMEQVVHTTPRGGAMGVGNPFYVNRLVGLVPVEADGSAHFEVPALRSLYFHALDADGKMLMTMGSDMVAMPGERRSCVGCHESRKNISLAAHDRPPLALGKPPVRPRLPDWGTHGILEYEAVVQPVLDKYCVRCHGGPQPDGLLNLSGDRTTVFNMSYLELVDKGLVHFVPGTGHTHAQPTVDYDQQAPLSRGTLLSRLTPYMEDPKHSEVTIPWEDRYRIYCWIDANVPFYSHYEQLSPTILSDPARHELQGIYQRRCAACHDQRPRKDAITWLSPFSIWVHTGPQPGQWGISESGLRVRHLNLTQPEHSLALQAPLAAAAGGLQMCVQPDSRPVFSDRNDPDYQRALRALREGVVRRDQPGVRALLNQTKSQAE